MFELMAKIVDVGKVVGDQSKLTFERVSTTCGSSAKCLVCNSELTATVTGDGGLPADEDQPDGYISSVKVYWILRQVLEVPLESLEAYLRSGRNPGEWLKICAACDKQFVEDVWRIWRELGEILRRFGMARRRLVEAMRSSVETEMQKDDEANEDKQFIRDITEETRKFVLNYKYRKLPTEHCFKTNDMTAQTLLKTREFKESQQVAVNENLECEPLPSSDELAIKEELAELSDINDDDFDFLNFDEDACLEGETTGKWDNEQGSDSDWDQGNESEEDKDTTTVEQPSLVKRRSRKVSRKKRCLKKLKSREELKCDQSDCNKIFDSVKKLQRHQANVHKMKVFHCFHCGWTTHLSDSLNQHLQRFHGTEEDVRQFTCTICDKQFAFKTTLANHNLRHHSDTPPEMFTCEHCGNQIASKSSYCRHLATVHGVKDYWRFPCDEPGCDKAFFTNSQLNRHKRVRHSSGEPQFKCHICGVKIRARQNLKRHMEQHSNPTLFQCDQCPLSFTTKFSLKQHVDKKHSANSSVNEVISSSISFKESLKCQECDWHFKQAWRYQRHMTELHGLQVEIPVKKNTSAGTTTKETACGVKTEEGTSKFTCSLCNAILTSKASLKLHIQYLHQKKLECCCDICGKVLRSRFYLARHKSNVHKIGNKVRPKIPCTVDGCEKTFNSPSRMRLHVLAIHERNPQFQCDHCGKKLVTNAHLQRHIRAMHTNRESKPFNCTVCGKGFAVKEYLWLHMKTHQPKENERNVENNVQNNME